MALTIRRVDLDRDRDELLDLLTANLPAVDHRRRFDWLYRAGPAGPAWSWFACDPASGRAVGTASVYPRAAWIDGRSARCGHVGDFAVDADHRSLGPAVMLQRATFEPVDRGELAFCYDCPPHAAGMAPFVRLGMKATILTGRYARLLRADRQIARRLGHVPGARALTTAANALLAARGRMAAPVDVEISVLEGRFGDEFTALDRETRMLAPIRARRSADDLNWGYRDDPLRTYDVLTARRAGELRGFIVLSRSREDASVIDVTPPPPDAVAVALLDAAREYLARFRSEVLYALAADASESSAELARTGFRRRSSGPALVAYTAPGSGVVPLLERPGGWRVQASDVIA